MGPSESAARALLRELGATQRLLRHVELVGEAAELLLTAATAAGAPVDSAFVRAGVLVHDIGKVLHPNELSGGGALHERAGEALLMQRNWEPRLARVCWTHANWSDPSCGLEELLIALADTLWKGRRSNELEERVVDALAERAGKDRWDIYTQLVDTFDAIADHGPDRLERSVT